MATNLTDFLLELAQDPLKVEAFHNDPRTFMTDAGLSEADQELLLSGDQAAINAAIDTERLSPDELSKISFVSVLHD